jgi:transposase InsO family protein
LRDSASRTVRTAFKHPEGNGMIERFHRSLKDEEIWQSRSTVPDAQQSNAR